MSRSETRLTSAASLLAVALLVAGCGTWRPVRGSVRPAVESPKVASTVRLHLRDGSEMTLHHPRIAGDSLIGERDLPNRPGPGFGEPQTGRYAVALDEVAAIDERRTSLTRTTLGVVGLVGLFVFVVAYANDPLPMMGW